MNTHYCMGKLVGGSITLSHPGEGHDCEKCGMKTDKKSKCCRDEQTIIKVNDSHQPVAFHFESFVFDIPVPSFSLNYPFLQVSETTPVFTSSSPPGNEQISLHTLHCNYRI
jgi:hypothetical protein